MITCYLTPTHLFKLIIIMVSYDNDQRFDPSVTAGQFRGLPDN